MPIAVEREVQENLREEQIIEHRAEDHMKDSEKMAYFEKIGNRVQALYGDEENPVTWYDAVVDRVLKKDETTGVEFYRPKFVVTFPEYENTETVTLGQMDMRGVDHSKPHAMGNARHGAADRNRGYEDRGRDRGYVDRGRDRGYGNDVRGRYHDRDRDYDRGHAQDDRGGGHRGNDRFSSSNRGYGGRDDRGYSRNRSSDDRGFTGGQSNDRDSGRKRHHRNDRSRSRDRELEKPKAAPPPKKTPEELAAIAQKKRKLLAKYG